MPKEAISLHVGEWLHLNRCLRKYYEKPYILYDYLFIVLFYLLFLMQQMDPDSDTECP